MQRYMQQYNEVELSALGMGTDSHSFFLFVSLLIHMTLFLDVMFQTLRLHVPIRVSLIDIPFSL